MPLKKCYLIGGAPLSGKTTLADVLAAEHQAVQLSTDVIREWMQRLTRKEDYPELFHDIHLGAEAYYRVHTTAQSVVDSEIAEGKEVEKGIKVVLDSMLAWERMVIEGIAITPESALALQKARPDLEFEMTFLYDDNVERITRRIHQRGLWGPKDSYPDYIKDKEVDWVVLYNDYYRREAKKHNLPLVHIDSL